MTTIDRRVAQRQRYLWARQQAAINPSPMGYSGNTFNDLLLFWYITDTGPFAGDFNDNDFSADHADYNNDPDAFQQAAGDVTDPSQGDAPSDQSVSGDSTDTGSDSGYGGDQSVSGDTGSSDTGSSYDSGSSDSGSYDSGGGSGGFDSGGGGGDSGGGF